MTRTAGGMSLDRGNVEFDFKGTMENRDIQEQGGKSPLFASSQTVSSISVFWMKRKHLGKKGTRRCDGRMITMMDGLSGALSRWRWELLKRQGKRGGKHRSFG